MEISLPVLLLIAGIVLLALGVHTLGLILLIVGGGLTLVGVVVSLIVGRFILNRFRKLKRSMT